MRERVLPGIKIVLRPAAASKKGTVPLIVSNGYNVHLTNEQIYKNVEFP